MDSRRGVELGLDMVVILSLALLVLLLVGAFYTQGFAGLSEKAMTFTAKSSDTASTAQTVKCNQLCSMITSCTDTVQIGEFIANNCDTELNCAMARECVSCDAPDPSLC